MCNCHKPQTMSGLPIEDPTVKKTASILQVGLVLAVVGGVALGSGMILANKKGGKKPRKRSSR